MFSTIKRALLGMISALGYEVQKSPDGYYQILPSIRLGKDPLADVLFILKNRVEIVFDVGANVGQTASRYFATFQRAEIFSFEPDHESFQKLSDSAFGYNRIHAFNLALGRSQSKALLNRYRMNETNSLLKKSAGAEDFVVDARYFEPTGTQEILISTIDAVCAENNINRIDLLKIDTQGYEIEVLEGARGMIASLSIPLIYTEVCFIRYYDGQPLFQDVYQYLYDLGYRLVGLYESGYLTHSYQTGGNALFVHQSFGQLEARTQKWRFGKIAFESMPS